MISSVEKNQVGKLEYRRCEVQEAVKDGVTEKVTFGQRPEVQLVGGEALQHSREWQRPCDRNGRGILTPPARRPGWLEQR